MVIGERMGKNAFGQICDDIALLAAHGVLGAFH